MRWKRHGRRAMYESDWVNVYLDDVELPDGTHIDHHVLEMPKHSVGAVVVDDQDRTLLIWRHRFITDKWGWEVPAGWVEPDEDPDNAIRREIEEETGYTADHIEVMGEYNPLAGISTMNYTMYCATALPKQLNQPIRDTNEVGYAEWLPLGVVAKYMADNQIPDGPSLTILSYYIATRR